MRLHTTITTAWQLMAKWKSLQSFNFFHFSHFFIRISAPTPRQPTFVQWLLHIWTYTCMCDFRYTSTHLFTNCMCLLTSKILHIFAQFSSMCVSFAFFVLCSENMHVFKSENVNCSRVFILIKHFLFAKKRLKLRYIERR